MKVKVLCIGDVVGRPGRQILADKLKKLKEKKKIDFCVVNGENVAGGSGFTGNLVSKLFHYGADIITSGDHYFRNPGILEIANKETRLLRPANFPKEAMGYGIARITVNDVNYVVINLVGRIFMEPLECPFSTIERILSQHDRKSSVIIVDVHAEATSEKVALGWFLDGKVSAVVGTHTHVQTADERVLPCGTAYMTDLGMTGSFKSVIGREIEPVLKKMKTGMPARFEVASDDVRLCGAIITIDTETGAATDIERIMLYVDTED